MTFLGRDQQSASAVGRIVAADNLIELSRVLSNPIGLEFIGSTADRYGDLVLRKNIVRQIVDTRNPRTDAQGIVVSQCARLIAENNVINDWTDSDGPPVIKPVKFTNCMSAKFFNNQDSTGTLLRAYNTTAAKYIQELEDEVQDVLLPI